MWKRPALHRALIPVLFFAVIAPTLTWLEFAGGMENFNVATALETVRDGHWGIPTMGEIPRLEKPPLTQWITSLGMLSSPHNLAWGARWPSLVIASVALVGVYELGRLLLGWEAGLIAACVMATNVLFFKLSRQATYDTHLACWVIWTNVFLVRWLYLKERWLGPMGAAICLGLAVMSKGPPAILQTIIPWIVFIIVERLPRPRGSILLALAIFFAITLPWPIYVIEHHLRGRFGSALSMWYNEVSMHDEAVENKTGWHTYFVDTFLLIPWVWWFFVALFDIVKEWKRLPSQLRLAVYFTFIPFVVMEFFPARRDRYMLPMFGPAAVITAWGILRTVPRWGDWDYGQMGLLWIHYVVLFGMACLLPIAGMIGAGGLRTATGAPWYSARFALASSSLALILFVLALVWYRRQWSGFVGGTVVLALAFTLIFNWGYRKGEGNVGTGAAAANLILSKYPDAHVYNAGVAQRQILPHLLLIYLNEDVFPLPDPSQLRPSRHAQVLVYPPKMTPNPPPGFVKLGEPILDGNHYPMFVRPGLAK
ncbi:MAG TPA: glycosyltransferase family 39 protein [Tepidisphaeraceae bacterium]|nr:glycosyltransferase family 39 protein [Tepidisphaeraceae bacterium]